MLQKHFMSGNYSWKYGILSRIKQVQVFLEMPLNNIGEAFGFSTFSTGSSKDHRSESSSNCIFILTELLNAAWGQVGYGVSNLGVQKQIILSLKNLFLYFICKLKIELGMLYSTQLFGRLSLFFLLISNLINTQDMTNPTIVSPVKMEYG